MFRVNVEGDKYSICGDDRGNVWIERFGEKWIEDPEGAKLWISVAHELYCLRKIAREAIKLVEYTDKGDSALLRGFVGGLADAINRCEGYTDFRRNLDDPGEM